MFQFMLVSMCCICSIWMCQFAFPWFFVHADLYLFNSFRANSCCGFSILEAACVA